MIYDLKKRAEEELVNNLGHFWLKLIDNENLYISQKRKDAAKTAS